MAAADIEHLDRFITSLPERARSFADRGATVPFTTPALAAARLRRVGTAQAELLLPAPGGRGTCVLDWGSCLGLSPTLHDRDLWARLDALPLVTPAGVRAAARATAATGLAGRAAQAAARAAMAAEATAREALERRFAALSAAAPLLASALASSGTHDACLESLSRLAETANAVALGNDLPAEREAARLVACAARLALSAARAALVALGQAVQSLPDSDMEAAFRIVALAERPDWLLDGWCLPVALLADGGRAGLNLRDVLASIAAPALEAERWWSSAGGWDAVQQGRDRLAPRPGWAMAPRTRMAPRLEAARAAAA